MNLNELQNEYYVDQQKQACNRGFHQSMSMAKPDGSFDYKCIFCGIMVSQRLIDWAKLYAKMDKH